MRRVAVALAVLLAGCAGAAAPPATPSPSDGRADAARLGTLEDEILHDLAALDRRVALRAHLTPSDADLQRVGMAAVLSEDASVVLLEGSPDPFSFAARGRGMGAVRTKAAGLPAATGEGALERELLVRLVDAEAVRLEEERALPRSASALVRALVQTWRTPATPAAAEQLDRGVSRRLAEVRTSLGTPLDRQRARDLDDALDALEHLADGPGLRVTTAEIARLREALEADGTRAPLASTSSWDELRPKVHAHLGVDLAPDALDQRLDRAEKLARALASGPGKMSEGGPDAIIARVEPLLFAEGPCAHAVPGSRVRSMAAPPEREPSCHLRRHAEAVGAATFAAVLHDHLVVARWALDLARGRGDLAAVTGRHHLLAPPSASLTAKLERVAVARPVAAIGAGLTAAMLLDEGGSPAARADAWRALGDVPLDVAARELARR